MFTGLIQGQGQLLQCADDRYQVLWGPHPTAIGQDLAIGDSVAVDGICLTVTEILPQGFMADVSPETLARTALGQRSPHQPVNLEASLRLGSKLGGHFVTGHIDGVGHLQETRPTATSWEMTFRVPAVVARYILPKGSIAVNGISLTIARCSASGDCFTVAVIPHTYHATNLCHLQVNSPVNLEGDILGKYVEKFLTATEGSPNSWGSQQSLPTVSLNFLADHGYY